jgi:hypothetical protein
MKEVVPEGMKKCRKCSCVKPLEDFNRDKTSLDGRYGYCRSCDQATARAHRNRNRARNSTPQSGYPKATKKCPQCSDVKPLADFARNITNYDGLMGLCRKCDSDRGSKWRNANPDKSNARGAKRRARKKFAHPDWADARLNRAIQVKYRLAKILEKQHGEPYQVDHIFPIKGYPDLPEGVTSIDQIDFYALTEEELMRWNGYLCGWHVPWNMQVITAAENVSKSNKIPTDRYGCKWSKSEDDY